MMPTSDRRARMLELVQRAHRTQSRNNGRVPYWTHLLAVAQIVERTLEESDEMPDAAEREEIFLAALGHDLYEDTSIQSDFVRPLFGDRVDQWIQGMTNPDENLREPYLATMETAPEEVRLLKLADLTENTASCSYAIVDMGVAWMREKFLPIVTEMRGVLRRTTFTRYPKAAASLQSLLDFHYERLERNIEMFEPAMQLKEPGPQPGVYRGPPHDFTEEEWAEGLARTRERERHEGLRFKGKVFPVMDKDTDSSDEE